ncbi:MAG: TetR/AcrR family transcriptional regulator [Rhodospirillaceae bacterium]|nr:TetR/AcrR family transcriptional regulator [Rhodospirillaceae bacterium]MDD9916246.1 TetR/AcrR family transcriptional regulator [Rhodospirillaceae bacterium]
MTYSEKAIEILEAAERHMRAGGYDAVSFRDLAAEVGIKSSSVHYHFPQKTDLGVAVVHRYREKVLTALGGPDDSSETAHDRMVRLCQVYRTALEQDGLNCLCCVLGAEARDLPDTVAAAVDRFFSSILDWIDTALTGTAGNRQTGTQILAGLQGAMILSMATGKTAPFDETVAGILDGFAP